MSFEPRNLASFVCSHVFRAERPILVVSHADGDWQFMCGGVDHGPDDCHLVGVGHLVDRDPSLQECSNLDVDCVAERAAVDQPWKRSRP